VARIISRDSYTAANAARELSQILSEPAYRAKACEVKSVIDTENGTQTACDAIESALQK
jgi:UDP:flavonoid glycosyltransferase YjiC (YdhE family)